MGVGAMSSDRFLRAARPRPANPTMPTPSEEPTIGDPTTASRSNPGRVRLSVVIRARNAESDLSELLPILRAQQGIGELQIVLVDNASTDRSAQIAREHGAEVVPLPDRDWSWGHALNVGFAHALGTFVAVLSADASPIGSAWARDMIRRFDEPRIAVAYGRQRPRPDAPLDEWCRVAALFPESDRTWTADDVRGRAIPDLIASNSCAVYRREDWERVPFERNIPSEERPWCLAVLARGRHVVYAGNPSVHHSHDEPRRRMALRILDVSTRGERPTALAVLRMMARFARTRCMHALRADAGARRRLRGIAALPGDAGAILVMGLRLSRGM